MKWNIMIVLTGIGYAFMALNILVTNSAMLNNVISYM